MHLNLFISISNRYNSSFDDENEKDDDDVLSNQKDCKSMITYLWEKTSRRKKCIFIANHESIVEICNHYLFVWILSNHADFKSDSWLNAKKAWLNMKMKETWMNIAHCLNKKSDHKWSEVNENSTESKTWRIINMNFSSWV